MPAMIFGSNAASCRRLCAWLWSPAVSGCRTAGCESLEAAASSLATCFAMLPCSDSWAPCCSASHATPAAASRHPSRPHLLPLLEAQLLKDARPAVLVHAVSVSTHHSACQSLIKAIRRWPTGMRLPGTPSARAPAGCDSHAALKASETRALHATAKNAPAAHLRLIMSSRPRQSSMTAHSRLVRRIASCRLSSEVRWYSMGAHCGRPGSMEVSVCAPACGPQ